MALFHVECADEGVFQIRTARDDEEVCSVVFEGDMDGALAHSAQRALMLKFSELMQKVCYEHWRRESGE